MVILWFFMILWIINDFPLNNISFETTGLIGLKFCILVPGVVLYQFCSINDDSVILHDSVNHLRLSMKQHLVWNHWANWAQILNVGTCVGPLLFTAYLKSSNKFASGTAELSGARPMFFYCRCSVTLATLWYEHKQTQMIEIIAHSVFHIPHWEWHSEGLCENTNLLCDKPCHTLNLVGLEEEYRKWWMANLESIQSGTVSVGRSCLVTTSSLLTVFSGL